VNAIPVRFRLNGESRTLAAAPDVRLIDLLRESCGLTAAKIACGIGRCGACLVLDAIPEGRAVREALVAEVSFQCGYCAPGFTVALTALLGDRPDAGEADIRAALEGNLCRCTGYHSILRGALEAQRVLQQRKFRAAS
jgi:carbon-monoxide dehydrogenase small subunit